MREKSKIIQLIIFGLGAFFALKIQLFYFCQPIQAAQSGYGLSRPASARHLAMSQAGMSLENSSHILFIQPARLNDLTRYIPMPNHQILPITADRAADDNNQPGSQNSSQNGSNKNKDPFDLTDNGFDLTDGKDDPGIKTYYYNVNQTLLLAASDMGFGQSSTSFVLSDTEHAMGVGLALSGYKTDAFSTNSLVQDELMSVGLLDMDHSKILQYLGVLAYSKTWGLFSWGIAAQFSGLQAIAGSMNNPGMQWSWQSGFALEPIPLLRIGVLIQDFGFVQSGNMFYYDKKMGKVPRISGDVGLTIPFWNLQLGYRFDQWFFMDQSRHYLALEWRLNSNLALQSGWSENHWGHGFCVEWSNIALEYGLSYLGGQIKISWNQIVSLRIRF